MCALVEPNVSLDEGILNNWTAGNSPCTWIYPSNLILRHQFWLLTWPQVHLPLPMKRIHSVDSCILLFLDWMHWKRKRYWLEWRLCIWLQTFRVEIVSASCGVVFCTTKGWKEAEWENKVRDESQNSKKRARTSPWCFNHCDCSQRRLVRRHYQIHGGLPKGRRVNLIRRALHIIGNQCLSR